MNLRLLLNANKTYQWTSNNSIHFLGFFFDENNQLYRNLEAINYISEQLTINTLEDICEKIDGQFTFIIEEKDDCILVSDALNNFPLFYQIKNETLYISDLWDNIIDVTNSFELNTNAIDEYKTAGFVLLNQTLAKDIFKTNANEILTLGKSIHCKTYQSFITNSFSDKSYEDLSNDTEKVLINVGKRLVKFLDNRTAVVPLSGGYDSRLIVSLLKKLKYKNVICFTYGKPNPEVKISEMAAKELGYNWHFIDFTKIDINAIQQQPEYTDYLKYAANGYSMPYLMEYFATIELKNKNLIPKDSVFLPGHSGDFLGGSYILKTVKNNIDFKNLPAFIESKYFNFIKKDQSQKHQIQNRIQESLQLIGSQRFNDYDMTVEQWDIQEKLSKFIFHSSQVFTFLGYEHYFPLWDKELVQFFRKMPYQYREGKKLYDDVLERYFFAPQHISYKKEELKVSNLQRSLQVVKDSVRYFFPWKMVLKRVNAADWPHYQALTKPMLDYIENQQNKKFTHFKAYNAVICDWYIQFLKDQYKTKS